MTGKWYTEDNVHFSRRRRCAPCLTVPSVVFLVKIPPLVVGCCETRGEFLPKIPRSQIPNFFSPAAGLQKLVFDDFTFCSPPQAENFVILRFRNTIFPGRRPGFRLQEGPSKFDVPRYMSNMTIYEYIWIIWLSPKVSHPVNFGSHLGHVTPPTGSFSV